MIYGLYLSAAGIVTNNYRQDLIANNLANAETPGFKRDLASFMERRTATKEDGLAPQGTNPLLEKLTGGILVQGPTQTDFTQGPLETSTMPMDAAIEGPGYFAVADGARTLLTRDGRMALASDNSVIQVATGKRVLGSDGSPIFVSGDHPVSIDDAGNVVELIGDRPVASGKLGTFMPTGDGPLKKVGGNAMEAAGGITPTNATIRPKMVELSNVDPTRELTSLIEAQRMLELNANMIRYQDQTLARLVTDVAKIG